MRIVSFTSSIDHLSADSTGQYLCDSQRPLDSPPCYLRVSVVSLCRSLTRKRNRRARPLARRQREAAGEVAAGQGLDDLQAEAVALLGVEVGGGGSAVVLDVHGDPVVALGEGDGEGAFGALLEAVLDGVLDQLVQDEGHRGRLVRREHDVRTGDGGRDPVAGAQQAVAGQRQYRLA